MDKGEIKEKYFAKILLNGVVDLKFIAREVEHSSSMSAADFEATTKHLVTLLKRHLCNGEIVDLGELGRFKPCFSSKACDNLEDVSVKTIENLRINYKANKQLLNAVKDTPLSQDRRFDEHGNRVEYSHTKVPYVSENN